MKKTLLLASVIVSMTTLASVSGSIETTVKGKTTFTKMLNKEVKVTGDLDELSLKGEVKVNKLTLGAVLKNKDIKAISKVNPLTTEVYTENLLDNSSVYAKYELPEFAGIKSYVKGTLNPKAKYEADGTLNFKKGNVELEGQLAHSFSNGAEVSLTSKTTFPFEKKDGEYGKAASSEHTLKLGAKKLNNFEDLEASLTIGHVYAKDGFRKAKLNTKGTYVGLKDTKLNGEFNFIDEKEDDGKTDKNMAVSLKAGANYKGVKDLELDGKFNFKYQVKGTSKVKDIITDSDIVLNKDAYAHSYELDAKYTGVKDLELTAGAFVQHIHFDEGGMNNYAANLDELAAANSLILNNSDLMKTINETLEKRKEKYKKALEVVKNTNDDKKKEYSENLELYKKLISTREKFLNNAVKAAKKAKEDLAEDKKAEANKSYEDETKLNKLNAEYDRLESLKDTYEKLYKRDAKADVKDNERMNAELSKIKEDMSKIEKEMATIGLVKENAGKELADAEDERDIFVKAKEENDKYGKYLGMKNILMYSVFIKQKDGTYKCVEEIKEIDNIKKEDEVFAKEVYSKLRSEYGKALDTIERFNDTSYMDKFYELKLKKYEGLKSKLDLVNFGFKLGAKYTGVKNLTLTADGVFAGRHHSGFNQLFKYPAYTTGYVKLHTGAKYDFKLLNDKLVVSPEANVTATFADIYAGMVNPSLVLAPKVSVEYNPMETLKVSGSVEVPVNFGINTLGDFTFKNTSIKGAFNMKYEWK